MRIAVVSDERYPVHDTLIAALRDAGHEVVLGGALASGHDEPWADVSGLAAREVAHGRVDEAVVCCWTGTGASIAANKVPGIRAALCTDARTAEGARVWNHANVLCLSNRLLSQDVCTEIVAAWLSTAPTDPRGDDGVARLTRLEGGGD